MTEQRGHFKHTGRVGSDCYGTYAPGYDCPCVALHIDEPEDSNSRWLIELSATTAAGSHLVGRMRTSCQAAFQQGPRKVANRSLCVAFMPGAIEWRAKVYELDVTSATHGAIFSWSDSPIGCAPGLTPLEGCLDGPTWIPLSATCAAGLTVSVAIAEGQVAETVSAWQVGDGGFLRVRPYVPGPNYDVALPPNGSISLRPGGRFWRPGTLTLNLAANLTGKGGLLVEVHL